MPPPAVRPACDSSCRPSPDEGPLPFHRPSAGVEAYRQVAQLDAAMSGLREANHHQAEAHVPAAARLPASRRSHRAVAGAAARGELIGQAGAVAEVASLLRRANRTPWFLPTGAGAGGGGSGAAAAGAGGGELGEVLPEGPIAVGAVVCSQKPLPLRSAAEPAESDRPPATLPTGMPYPCLAAPSVMTPPPRCSSAAAVAGWRCWS